MVCGVVHIYLIVWSVKNEMRGSPTFHSRGLNIVLGPVQLSYWPRSFDLCYIHIIWLQVISASEHHKDFHIFGGQLIMNSVEK